MNYRYLFRAKRKNNGEWVEGDLSHHKTGKVFMKPFHGSVTSSCEVDADTICQCTGLKDKNGKLIWENDIVEACSQGMCAIGKIKHRIDGTWIMYPAWHNRQIWYLLPDDDGVTTVEVIGNIFDNPELLKK